jgi:predicted nucleotidyltransferase
LTAHPDVDAALAALLAGAREILAPQFVGVYLRGSLATGDFRPETSDVDFLVATADEVPDDLLEPLQTLHERLVSDYPTWGVELEGSYISVTALRRHDPLNAVHPHIERGGRLARERHWSDWVLERHLLREHGIALAGPPPRSLVDPIGPEELRRAVRDIVREWWAPMIPHDVRLAHDGYRAYAVLTMCRALHTLEHGTVVPKREAARWASDALPDRWSPLIDRAAAWAPGARLDGVDETLPFIAFVIAEVEAGGRGSRKVRGYHLERRPRRLE